MNTEGGNKNRIIVIEGIDGCGKETQSKLLVEYFKSKNKNVLLQSFPNYASESSGPVKMYLNGELSDKADEIDAFQSSILFAADRFCTLKKIFKETKENSIIIFDRYVESNMIHQGGKIKDKQKLTEFLDWLNDLEYITFKLPKPDVVFFLNMSPEKSIELATKRLQEQKEKVQDIHEKDKEHLINAFNTGVFLSDKFKWNVINCQNDNGDLKTREEIHQDIINELTKINII